MLSGTSRTSCITTPQFPTHALLFFVVRPEGD
jgi:hypothetical protein